MANIFIKTKNKISDSVLDNKVPVICCILIVLFLLVFFHKHIFISIQSGQGGVLYKRFTVGTVLDKVYGEGFHVIPPWDKMYVYNTRVQEKQHQMKVLSSNGLMFQLELSIRYRPEYEFLGYLHKSVGPDYVPSIVIPEVESVMRTLIGNFTPDEVYTTKRGIVNKYIFSAFSELNDKYIIIDDVIIREVQLPSTIKDAIEHKLIAEQKVQEYEYLINMEKKEKERKVIEAEGIQKYQEIVSKTLTDKLLKWQGIKATLEISKSQNAKIVIIGRAEDGLPIILDMKQGSDSLTGTGTCISTGINEGALLEETNKETNSSIESQFYKKNAEINQKTIPTTMADIGKNVGSGNLKTEIKK